MTALLLVVLLNHLLVAIEMLHMTCVVTLTDMPSAKLVSKDVIESVACIQRLAHASLIPSDTLSKAKYLQAKTNSRFGPRSFRYHWC